MNRGLRTSHREPSPPHPTSELQTMVSAGTPLLQTGSRAERLQQVKGRQTSRGCLHQPLCSYLGTLQQVLLTIMIPCRFLGV